MTIKKVVIEFETSEGDFEVRQVLAAPEMASTLCFVDRELRTLLKYHDGNAVTLDEHTREVLRGIRSAIGELGSDYGLEMV